MCTPTYTVPQTSYGLGKGDEHTAYASLYLLIKLRYIVCCFHLSMLTEA